MVDASIVENPPTSGGGGGPGTDVSIVDAGSGESATVLAPSTAPSATDQALVVAISPNSPGVPQATQQTANIDAGNSTTTPLGGGAVFTGVAIDVSNYASIHVNYFTDADGTLSPQFSSDGINWDIQTALSIEANVAGHAYTGPDARFFRVVLTNGATPQSFLRLQVIENYLIAAPHAQKIALPIEEDDDAILVKATLVGKTSTAQLPPTYKDALVDQFGALQVGLRDVNGNGVYASPFNELRVAAPYTLFDLVNKYEIDPNVLGINIQGGGSATFLPDQSAIKLTISGSPGDVVTLRTHTFFRYQAGRALNAKFTAYHLDTGQLLEQRNWGFFCDSDGVFFQLNEFSLRAVIRSSTTGSPVDTIFEQADWNIDPYDGSGASGSAVDVTMGNIWEVEFQWLGVGSVNFYINGVLVHRVQHANTLAKPYMRTATLPLTWEVKSI